MSSLWNYQFALPIILFFFKTQFSLLKVQSRQKLKNFDATTQKWVKNRYNFGFLMMLQNWIFLFILKVKRWVTFCLVFSFVVFVKVFSLKFENWFVLQLHLEVDESYNLFVSKATGFGKVIIEVWFWFCDNLLLLNSDVWWCFFFIILLCEFQVFVVPFCFLLLF